MKTGLKIFGFVLAVLAFYSYVGQTVPQKITYPPETTDLSGDLTPTELAVLGGEIVSGKGTCLGCHTVGSDQSGLRFPDLGGIGTRAGSRVDGMSDVAYLAQSLYDPSAFIVDGFLPGMPVISKPPIGLSDQEILAVIAYLQSQGGEPTVTLDTKLDGQSEAGSAPRATAAPATTAATVGAGLDGKGVFETFMCATCHAIDGPNRLVGPSLYDVGNRLSRADIYESVMDPDAKIADGYPGGVMIGTLTASGFYDKVSPKELRALIDFLTAHTGE